jgi:hypothetical protein
MSLLSDLKTLNNRINSSLCSTLTSHLYEKPDGIRIFNTSSIVAIIVAGATFCSKSAKTRLSSLYVDAHMKFSGTASVTSNTLLFILSRGKLVMVDKHGNEKSQTSAVGPNQLIEKISNISSESDYQNTDTMDIDQMGVVNQTFNTTTISVINNYNVKETRHLTYTPTFSELPLSKSFNSLKHHLTSIRHTRHARATARSALDRHAKLNDLRQVVKY